MPGAAFRKKAPESIPAELGEALGPIVATVASLTETIAGYGRAIGELAKKSYPEVESVGQVGGVGTPAALTLVPALEDPARFGKSRGVGAYVGLVPGRDQSGGRDPQKRITKEGDEMPGRLLLGSAHCILGPFAKDSGLRRHGGKLMAQGGKRAK